MEQTQQQQYRDLIAAYARGETRLAELPLGEATFWQFAVVRAARPGRSSVRLPNLGIAAERLLRGPLPKSAESAKIAGLVAALRRPDTRARRMAIHLLHEAPFNNMVLQAASDATEDSDQEVRLSALVILAENVNTLSMPHFLSLLAGTSDIRATVAADALARLGAPAVPGLSRLLDSPDEPTRWRATRCLARIDDEAGAEPLIKAFHDDSPGIAWAAADGLLQLGPAFAGRLLQSVLEAPVNATVIRALHHYAEHAKPAATFHQLQEATTGFGVGSATLVAVDSTLKKLRAHA